MNKVLIKNIGWLATPQGNQAKKGKKQGAITYHENTSIYIEDGIISAIDADLPENDACVIDAQQCLVTPGLVDAHTHLVFGGWRQNELGLKLHGISYLDILKQGGGILSTVESTRQASKEELTKKATEALNEMLSYGTTTCEAKSGYGLDLDTEIKQLEIIHELNERHVIDLVSTFLGAHAIPLEYNEKRDQYVDWLCTQAIPLVAKRKLARFCDVFCEKGTFTLEESQKILTCAKTVGLLPKIHADEIESLGGSRLAGEIHAISAEHLIVCPKEGIESLAKGGTIACLLPMTSFYLGSSYAPARAMINAGVPVALASDFNPGSCPSLNMQLVMNLGCLKYHMTPEEVLTAVTLNGAAAIQEAQKIGSIEVGKQADIVIWNAPDLNYICYRVGSNLAQIVLKKGKIVSIGGKQYAPIN